MNTEYKENCYSEFIIGHRFRCDKKTRIGEYLTARGGFSLIEVLITLMVVSLLFAAMIPALMSSKQQTVSAPWRYISSGDITDRGGVYGAYSDNSVAVIGSNVIPYDHNVTPSARDLFDAQNPKLLIVTGQDEAGTDREGVHRNLLGFYQNRSDGEFDYIGKLSFDKDYNLAMGQYALEGLKNTGRTALEYSDWPNLASGTPRGMFNTAVGQYAMSGNITQTGTAPTNSNTGFQNTALGAFAIKNNTTGSNNTALGYI